MSDEEIEKWNYRSLKEFFDEKLVTDKMMQMLIHTMQAGICFGSSPAETSAGEYLKSIKMNTLVMGHGSPVGGGYPLGGCGVIPETYCQCITENNGKVKIGKEGNIRKIVVKDGEIKGVEVGSDKTFFEADIIIANSDIKTTVLNLVGEKYFSKDYVKYIEGLKWGVQACSLKIGVDKIVTDQKHITYIPPIEGMDNSFAFLEENIEDLDLTDMEVPEKSVQLIIPVSNHDPSLAPPGCQNIHTVTATSFGKIINWDKQSDEKWRQCCLNSLASLWPDLEDHIVISDFLSTSMLSARFGKEGVGIGIRQSKDQVFSKRPSQISPIKGLYYSSADAGGWGIGTELAAQSALELWDYFQANKIL